MKWKASLISTAILLIFAVVIAGVTLRLRRHIRGQILSQTGSMLHATAHFEAARAGGRPLDLVLGMVEIEGILGIRFYSPELEPVASLPRRLVAQPMPASDLDTLRVAGSMTRLIDHSNLARWFDDPDGTLSEDPVPMLVTVVQLDNSDTLPLRGYIEFFMDGLPTAAAFRALDRNLLHQSLVAFLVGGGAIFSILLVGFRRLEGKNRELVEANRELTRHAKAAAIGAISAHLFHGLKHAVGDLDCAPSSPRLQAMIQDVMDVIQEGQHNLVYSLSGDEVLRFSAERLDDVTPSMNVRLRLKSDPDIQFSNRRGNLLILAIQNLLQNAVEASPADRTVEARITRNHHDIICRVRDQGAGIPPDRQARLFDAGFSSKPDGSGLGLSISRQLCRSFDGDLDLVETGAGGTVFEIRVPGPSATDS